MISGMVRTRIYHHSCKSLTVSLHDICYVEDIRGVGGHLLLNEIKHVKYQLLKELLLPSFSLTAHPSGKGD